MSARGWGYQLESYRLINKDQFDRVQNLINECRKRGYLPVDFIAEDKSRDFVGVETPETRTKNQFLTDIMKAVLEIENQYTPDWWEGEKYYIQMLVEKVDLKTLFRPVCSQYHIPIATSKGWSSITQRAVYAQRFKRAEELGLQCVLLYCGDFDPDGLRISDFIEKNLWEIARIRWSNGERGYYPEKLIIDRFGLNLDFIEANNLTWINNLITGSKKNLASPRHPNYNMDYVQDYLADIGERKCEANAIVTKPREAQQLCRDAIESYIGSGARSRFRDKRAKVKKEFNELRDRTGITESLKSAIAELELDEELQSDENEGEQ